MSTIIDSLLLFGILAWLAKYWPIVLILIVTIVLLLVRATKQRKENLFQLNVSDYNNLSGEQFEIFVAELLKRNGYSNLNLTSRSGDFGVDILATKQGIKYAFQCKRYSDKVGNHAVQEAYSGMAYYNAHKAVVVTNNFFTQAAIETARKIGVELWDRNTVEKLIRNMSAIQTQKRSLNQKVPENDRTINEHSQDETLAKTISLDAYYRFRKGQLAATKVNLILDSDKMIIREAGGCGQCITINIDDIYRFRSIENMMYAGEAIGRTTPNCVAAEYLDRLTMCDKRIDIRIHKAQEMANTLNSFLKGK